MISGIELIANERKEQKKDHGRTIEKDYIENDLNQLVFASKVMLKTSPQVFFENEMPKGWSAEIWDNMLSKPIKERLIIAGALIAAELDRIQYAENLNQTN